MGEKIKFLTYQPTENHRIGTVSAIHQNFKEINQTIPGKSNSLVFKDMEYKKPNLGAVLVKEEDQSIQKTKIFTSLVYSINSPPFSIKKTFLLHFESAKVKCKLLKIDWRVSLESESQQKIFSPKKLENFDFAQIVFESPNFYGEIYDGCSVLSRFSINLQKNQINLIGIVTHLLPFHYVWSPQSHPRIPSTVQVLVEIVLLCFKRIQKETKLILPKPILHILLSKSILT